MKVTITSDEGIILETYWVLMDDAPIRKSTDVAWVRFMILESQFCVDIFDDKEEYIKVRDFQD
jgi:hypothetical protein